MKIIFYDLLFCSCKNELLFFNRQELLKKAKDRYHNCGGKEKAAEYYTTNKDISKENAKNKYRNLAEVETEAKRNIEEIDIET